MLITEIVKLKSAVHDSDYFIDNHFHDLYEIVYYIQGHGITTIDGVDYTFGPNQFSVISPRTVHSERSAHEIIKLTYVRFSINKKDFILKSGVFNDGPNSPVMKLFERIVLEKKQGLDSSDDLADTLISELAILISRIQKIKTPNNSFDKFAVIETYIKCNINNRINGKTIADKISYNYDYFRKMFKEHYGVSVNSYITSLKLENALTLLKSKKYTIKEVSTITGFNTPSHFINLFKLKYKMTPLEYMESINLININKDDANYKIYGKIKNN